MHFKKTYSLADIARKMSRPRTTLADWMNQFREFIPTVGKGRVTRYTEDAIEIFNLICKMKESNEPPEYIKDQLRGLVKEIIIEEEESIGSTPYLVTLQEDMNDIKMAVMTIMQHLDELKTMDSKTKTVVNDVARRLNDLTENVSLHQEMQSNRFTETQVEISNVTEKIKCFSEQTNSIYNQIRERYEAQSAQLETVMANIENRTKLKRKSWFKWR